MGIFHKELDQVKKDYEHKEYKKTLSEITKRQEDVKMIWKVAKELNTDLQFVHTALENMNLFLNQRPQGGHVAKAAEKIEDPFEKGIDELKEKFERIHENSERMVAFSKRCK